MKVIIAGGRFFTDYQLLKESCDKLLMNQTNIEIVSGTCKGADLLGERYAKERGYKIKRFPADWISHPRSGGVIRNKIMAEYSDALISFWDGKSKGTSNMIKLAEKRALKVRIIKY